MPMTALSEGEMTTVRVGTEDVLIIHVHGQYFAISSRCTHAGRSLAGGILRGFELTCPGHGASFDVRTGAVLGAPAQAGLKRFPVVVETGKIYLLI